MRGHRWKLAPCLILILATLIGCSSGEKQMEVCPRVAVLSEAGRITRFQPGPGRDILDINFQGDIGDIVASCRFSDAQQGARRVSLEVAPVFVFNRGAANREPLIDFTYFVSVVRDGDILSKEEFEAESTFSANRSRMIVRDDNPPITVDIPLPYKGAVYEYEVLVGFQLTPDELDYNQRRQGLGR